MQRPSTHFNALQRTAMHCNALQRTATHCNTLQRTATHCNALQRTAINQNSHAKFTATHCNTLQRTRATRNSHTWHTAAHCNALRRLSCSHLPWMSFAFSVHICSHSCVRFLSRKHTNVQMYTNALSHTHTRKQEKKAMEKRKKVEIANREKHRLFEVKYFSLSPSWPTMLCAHKLYSFICEMPHSYECYMTWLSHTCHTCQRHSWMHSRSHLHPRVILSYSVTRTHACVRTLPIYHSLSLSCMHALSCTRTQAHTHTHTHAFTHARTHTHTHTRTHMYTHTHTHIHTHTHAHIMM